MPDIVSDYSDSLMSINDGFHSTADVRQRMRRVYLLVHGMNCPVCALRVRSALLAIEGVTSARVLLDHGVALVHYDEELVSFDDLVVAIAQAGADDRHSYAARVLNGSS